MLTNKTVLITGGSGSLGHALTRLRYLRKHTLESVRGVFADRGYTLMATAYRHNHERLPYICPTGHRHAIALVNFLHGHGCPDCRKTALAQRFSTPEHEVRECLKRFGYTLLSGYKNRPTPIDYRCDKGHVGRMRVGDLIGRAQVRCRQCYLESNRGPKHHSWNPRLSDEDRIVKRYLPEYRVWREAVFIRDNYTCSCCGQRGGTVNAHHLVAYADNKRLRFELDNGTTLCQSCHRAFHVQFGWTGFSRVDFDRFRKSHAA